MMKKKEKLLECDHIATDLEDNIFVAGEKNHPHIWKFDSNLKFITKFGSSDSGDGQLEKIGSIAVDSEGNVYVMDMGDFSIKKFSPAK